MKKYDNLDAVLACKEKEAGRYMLKQDRIDEYHSHLLNVYRVAAAYALAALTVAREFMNGEKKSYIEKMEEVIAECQEVLKDEAVYEADPSWDCVFTKDLTAALDKAEIAVRHAGGMCSGFPPNLATKKIDTLIRKAGNMCDRSFKRRRF